MSERHAVHGRAYLLTWLGLLALTAGSFGLSFAPLGEWGMVLSLSIAFVKALLVVLIFMHLLESVFATRMVVLINLLWIALLCLGIVADVGFR